MLLPFFLFTSGQVHRDLSYPKVRCVLFFVFLLPPKKSEHHQVGVLISLFWRGEEEGRWVENTDLDHCHSPQHGAAVQFTHSAVKKQLRGHVAL